MQRRVIYLVIGLAVLSVAWYLFRPELLFINKTVDEKLPVATVPTSATGTEAVALSSGSFQGLAHETKGIATIHRLPDGKRILRLTEFETSNGPDVRVYLVAAPDAKDAETVKRAGFIDLGSMKGNRGNQNYDVPPDAGLGSKQISVRQYLVPPFRREFRRRLASTATGEGRLAGRHQRDSHRTSA